MSKEEKLFKRKDGKVVDEHGTVQKTFDDYKNDSETKDEVQVKSDATSAEVARAAIMQNPGFALGGDFNIADGEFLIGGHDDPEYKAYAIREDGMLAGLRLEVEDWAIAHFNNELKLYKERWAQSDKSDIAYSMVPNRHVTGWIVEYLNFHYHVHPYKDSKEFDAILAEHFPDCFIIPGAAEEAKKYKPKLH